ncbi:MAG: ElyC/SanA/YdcF family protein [Candidatus Omnitrophota bacterium]
MLKKQDVICVSSIDWDFIWQGHQEIMSTLADHGNRVLFIENTGVRTPSFRDIPRLRKRIYNWLHSVKGVRKIKDNLYVYSPIILPFPYSRIARFINRHLLLSTLSKWIKSMRFSSPILWTFLPTALVQDIIDAIDSKLVVYYCIDNFSASSSQAKKIKKAEARIVKNSDLVFVTAKNLYDYCSQYNKDVHVFPYGVNMEIYEKVKGQNAAVPEDMKAIKHPIVGYVGGVHKWIDFELIKFLAVSNPDKSFVFVGPLQQNVDELKNMPNIYFLGQKQYAQLPYYVLQFDTCLIPYLITDYTKNVYPTKINEYLSLGKSVVSTAIPEVTAFNERNDDVIYIGINKEEMNSNIGKVLKEKSGTDFYSKRVAIAEKEGSWKIKIEKMCDLIEKKISQKDRERSLKWKDSLLKMYRMSKRWLVYLLGVSMAAYLLLFCTPFIWFVGEPLKVSSRLEKADAIVVFAGGVGESGKAGQGYEERVKYAVDLYKEGYAKYLIFSSGYVYAIKESEIMQALAVSLGVPPNAIVLEERATNTYQNVAYSVEILRKMHMKRAIIVSSPYNMLRISLVCNKNVKDIRFMYMPIPYSIFFGDGKIIRHSHIFAITHEYLGIAYYWFKGYI